MAKCKVTAMVSIYNSGEWIENRINNLLNSTIIDDMEIFCINANSPDERDDKIPKQYGSKIKYIKLDKRVNVYAAWNIIIKEANGVYLTNANTDDIVAPDCYEKLSSILDGCLKEQHNTRKFVYPSWATTATANQTWPPTIGVDPLGGFPGKYCGNVETAGVGHFPMWCACLHDELGLFDEDFNAMGDADWWARCYHVGGVRFHWANEILCCYLWRNGDNLWHRAINSAEWHLYHKKLSEYEAAARNKPTKKAPLTRRVE
jgi:hypothetical protein